MPGAGGFSLQAALRRWALHRKPDGTGKPALVAVRTDEHRREVGNRFRSGADVLIEKGRQEGRQEGAIRALQGSLVNLVRTKFGRLPRATEKVIGTTQDPELLEAWLVRAGTASTLAEIEFSPGTPSSSGGARGSK